MSPIKVATWSLIWTLCIAIVLWFLPESLRFHEALARPQVSFLGSYKAPTKVTPCKVLMIGDSTVFKCPWKVKKVWVAGYPKSEKELHKRIAETKYQPDRVIISYGMGYVHEKYSPADVQSAINRVRDSVHKRFGKSVEMRIISPYKVMKIAKQYGHDGFYHPNPEGYDALKEEKE